VVSGELPAFGGFYFSKTKKKLDQAIFPGIEWLTSAKIKKQKWFNVSRPAGLGLDLLLFYDHLK
jgi:hypothetical protein